MADDPLAKKLEDCDSVDFITAILQEEAQIFGGFKDDGMMMNSLGSSVDVLYTLSNSTTLGQVVGPFYAGLVKRSGKDINRTSVYPRPCNQAGSSRDD